MNVNFCPLQTTTLEDRVLLSALVEVKKGKHSIKVLLNMCLTNEFQPKNIFSPLSYNWSAPKSLFRCKETRELLSQENWL